MVGVQYSASGLHIDTLPCLLAPGQLQTDIQIVADHCGLGRSKGLLGQAVHLFVELFRHLLGEPRLFDFLAVLSQLTVAAVPLAQFALDGLELLPENVVPLVAGKLVPDLGLHILLQLEDLHLPFQGVA